MSIKYTVKTDITKESGENDMVAALLGLKAQRCAGTIDAQRFRVECLHVIWCAQQSGRGEAVVLRVNNEWQAIEARPC